MKEPLNTDNPFKNSRGHLLTTALFWEYRVPSCKAVFVLSEEDRVIDGVEYKSLKKLFIEARDIQEYKFATDNLFNWEQWKKMQGNKKLLPHIEEWREELRLLMESEALQALYITATTEGSKGTAAARYLVDKGYLPKEEKKNKPLIKPKLTESDNISDFLKRVK